jgi:beta-glucosidase
MKLINQKADFIGINLYSGERVAMVDGKPKIVPHGGNTDFTAMDWAVTPDCLYYNAKFLYERYKLPMLISENGVALSEWPNKDGNITDDSRIEYIRAHLKGVERAINEKIPIGGYFYWSLMDNFEWASGNSKRFGLIRVNFDTQERTLKKSAGWYGELIASNGKNL